MLLTPNIYTQIIFDHGQKI